MKNRVLYVGEGKGNDFRCNHCGEYESAGDAVLFAEQMSSVVKNILKKHENCELCNWQQFIDNDLGAAKSCWITREGNIIPVRFAGHTDMIDFLRDHGLVYENEGEAEKDWVKFTTACFDVISVHSWARVLTGKQKITIYNIIVHHNLLKGPGQDYCHIGNGNTVYREKDSGKIKFDREE